MNVENIKKINKRIVHEDGTVDSFQQQIIDLISGNFDTSYSMVVASDTQSLEYVGAINKEQPLLMNVSTFVKLQNKHNLDLTTICNIEKMLKDSVLAFESLTENGSVVIVTEQHDKFTNEPIIISLRYVKTVGAISVNEVTSVYDRHKFVNFIENTFNKDRMFYKNEKTEQYFHLNRLQLSQELSYALSNKYYRQSFSKKQYEEDMKNEQEKQYKELLDSTFNDEIYAICRNKILHVQINSTDDFEYDVYDQDFNLLDGGIIDNDNQEYDLVKDGLLDEIRDFAELDGKLEVIKDDSLYGMDEDELRDYFINVMEERYKEIAWQLPLDSYGENELSITYFDDGHVEYEDLLDDEEDQQEGYGVRRTYPTYKDFIEDQKENLIFNDAFDCQMLLDENGEWDFYLNKEQLLFLGVEEEWLNDEIEAQRYEIDHNEYCDIKDDVMALAVALDSYQQDYDWYDYKDAEEYEGRNFDETLSSLLHGETKHLKKYLEVAHYESRMDEEKEILTGLLKQLNDYNSKYFFAKDGTVNEKIEQKKGIHM